MNEIDLNDLAIKTDNLPDNWKMLLIDPTNGLPAKNITVARFIELLINKIPEATETSKGLMSSQSLKSNPFSTLVNRKIFTPRIFSKKSFKIRTTNRVMNINIKVLGGWGYGNGFGVVEKVICYYGADVISGTKSYKCSSNTCSVCYISDPYKEGDYICVDIVNKYNQSSDLFSVTVESFNTFDDFEFMNDQTPRSEDLTKNNRNETEFAFRTVNTSAASPNVLTDTISTSPVLESRQVLGNLPANTSISNSSLDESTQLDNPDGSIPVKNELQEQYIWSIDKIGRAVLELQEENKRLKQILSANGIEVQIK